MKTKNKKNIFKAYELKSIIPYGSLSIAVGIALGIKRKKIKNKKVLVYADDLNLGTCNECIKYAKGHNLPITFITNKKIDKCKKDYNIIRYKYKRGCLHEGVKEWINFNTKKK